MADEWMNEPEWIGVDLDSTLAEFSETHFNSFMETTFIL